MITRQHVYRWCDECVMYTPSDVDSHAAEYCLTCHPEPGYDTWDEGDDDF